MGYILKGGSWFSASITKLCYFTWEGTLDKKTNEIKGFRILKLTKI